MLITLLCCVACCAVCRSYPYIRKCAFDVGDYGA